MRPGRHRADEDKDQDNDDDGGDWHETSPRIVSGQCLHIAPGDNAKGRPVVPDGLCQSDWQAGLLGGFWKGDGGFRAGIHRRRIR